MSNITEEQPEQSSGKKEDFLSQTLSKTDTMIGGEQYEVTTSVDPTTGMSEEDLVEHMSRKQVMGFEGPVSDHLPLTFGVAISFAKQGHKVARSGWNEKGMWVAYSPGSEALPATAFWSTANKEYAESVGGSVKVLPCLTMKTATGEILMGWLASQSDMLADDWMVVE